MKSKSYLYVEDLEELFVDVQVQRIFKDQKFFTDCVPKYPVKEILKNYRSEKKWNGFELRKFCEKNFEFPIDQSTGFKSDKTKSVEEHIEALWNILTKQPVATGGTLIQLPKPFVVPGGRFREIYYWDSYFTMLGLQVSKKIDLIENMIENFSYLIDEFGFIPNGNRTYFLSRSQPPFFSLMVELLSEEKGKELIVKYLPQLEKEYLFWMQGSEKLKTNHVSEKHVVMMPGSEILNRYWDNLNEPRQEAYVDDLITAQESGNTEIFRHIRAAAESGWDFSSRWFKDAHKMSTISTTDIVPIDLNCLLFHLEKTLQLGYEFKKEKANADKYYELSIKREAAIQKYLWDERNSTFVDYDLKNKTSTGNESCASASALFLNIATNDQARRISEQIKSKFLQKGGLVTTLSKNHQQWDAPNGWAPLQWIAYKGLLNYNIHDVAVELKSNWLTTIEQVFKNTGKLTEKYNVLNTEIGAEGGEYPNQDGFGWTNGVYLKMKISQI